ENPGTRANNAPTDGGGSTPRVAQTTSVVPLAQRPLPVRTPARIMRVWIASWEDTKG
ncbi:MAG: TraV family lipoprotein, partial [Gammaproteobacteria bacterium]|nr:TraV family lipoprotein [Gammaproteobacteria bacterium]NIR83857.1 TraV family lipoprotein [Gammaproteobacteria bacterium]NIU05168.1 TraV family lipoprotein [Gammaproteobacteria bacterium]NIV51998.1 TraV family lipoprotein [Gammaproteobacteria bacterium]NIV73317.1 TraV family lipoprotein [Gammaproteobacteria bacterium]